MDVVHQLILMQERENLKEVISETMLMDILESMFSQNDVNALIPILKFAENDGSSPYKFADADEIRLISHDPSIENALAVPESTLPAPLPANHPANTNPSRVGLPGDTAIDPSVVVDTFPISLPPCSSVDTVNVFAVHCAYNVALVVNGYDAKSAYGVPEPFASVFHPANV